MTPRNNSRRPPTYVEFKAVTMVMIVILTCSANAYAQEWRFDPAIAVGAEYDDNPRLTTRTDEEVNLDGFLVDLSAKIDYSSERTSFTLLPRYLIRDYPDDPQFESDDVFVRGNWRHNLQSSFLAFRVNYDRQSVRTGERADVEFDLDSPDDISDTDTGLVSLNRRRDKWRFRPSWGYDFSSTSSMAVGLEYYNVKYEDLELPTDPGGPTIPPGPPTVNFLNDYDDTRLNVTFRHGFSNINTGLVTATARRYETADGLTEVTGYGAQAGLERSITQTTTLRGMVGVETTDVNAGETDTNVVGDLTLTRDLETISLLAQYRRAVVGSGRGRVSLRESLSLNMTRALTEKVSAGLGIRAYQASGLSDATGTSDRDYVQLRSQFDWLISRSFSMEFDYAYTILNRENLGEKANSNHVFLWLKYQPNSGR